jgi:hypothetical protein
MAVVGPLRDLWPPDAILDTKIAVIPPRPDISVAALGEALPAATAPLRRPLLHEDAAVDIYLDGPGPSTLRVRPRSDSAELAHGTSTLQHYRVTYRGAVGEIEWHWTCGLGTVLVQLEVFPTKLDYRRDYEAIRQDLLNVAPQLMLSVRGQAGERQAERVGIQQAAEVEWLEHVRREHDRLERGITRLLPRLRADVQRHAALTSSDRLRRARPLAKRDYGAIHASRPRTISVGADLTSEQTPLNGYLRWEVDQLAATVTTVLAQEWISRIDPEVLKTVRSLAAGVSTWQARLRHVVPVRHAASLHTRLRDPHYGSVLTTLRRLRSALHADDEAELVGLKDLPTLYEYWVFLTLVDRVRQTYPDVTWHGPALVRKLGGDLVMARGAAARVVMRNSAGGMVTCVYNRRFGGLPTTAQQPDSVIELQGRAGLLILDAKYRLGRDADYLARYGSEGPLYEDINVLHQYRDAIVNTQPPHRRLVAGGLIAFPGRDTRRFRAHRFCRSWAAVWVGGVPMLPGGGALLDECLEQFFDVSREEVESA